MVCRKLHPDAKDAVVMASAELATCIDPIRETGYRAPVFRGEDSLVSVKYFAHSGNKPDGGDWQRLPEHLLAVAELAGTMAAPLGLDRAARLAGLLHDLGKYTEPFQQRLRGGLPVDHSTAGAAAIMALGLKGSDGRVAEQVAYCILGHHAGLPDRLNDTESCFEARLKRFDRDPSLLPDPVWRDEIRLDPVGLLPASFTPGTHPPFQLSVIARMIFSCLVDADFKDTERYYCGLGAMEPDRAWSALQDMLPDFIARFDAYLASRAGTDTDLNRLRGEILAHVRARSNETRGLFTLTVPTGGGKTLTSLGFALDHALKMGHSRIIYAIPFTSIIDQTAAIFRDVLGEDHVLEHHSAIEEAAGESDRRWQSRDRMKLAMEDWAAPVVVTTNVQFFESLFAARPSRARKLHNIANSVIILDEAQTIPRPLLMPAIRMLDELALNYGCSIVLCTATQPALDMRSLKGGLPLEGRELAPDPRGLARKLRRATIEPVRPMSNADLVSALAAEPEALVIVNSRRHALDLYREAEAAGLAGLVHLSTRQHASDRRLLLADIRSRLRHNQQYPDDMRPCRVVSTSLIEAGVDVDFPRVWRAEAGLDQIVQAAGRCNREGKRPLAQSVVTVFSCPDYPPPAEIRGLIGDMGRASDNQADPLSLEAMERYFSEVYWRFGGRLDDKKIVEAFKITRLLGSDFCFRTVAEKFRMIESGMVPVIIASDETAKDSVRKLDVANISSGSIARKLQAYVVQIPPRARQILVENGHVSFARKDLRGEQFAILNTDSLYGRDVGLLWEDADYLGEESRFI